jgi:hypothetical protein
MCVKQGCISKVFFFFFFLISTKKKTTQNIFCRTKSCLYRKLTWRRGLSTRRPIGFALQIFNESKTKRRRCKDQALPHHLHFRTGGQRLQPFRAGSGNKAILLPTLTPGYCPCLTQIPRPSTAHTPRTAFSKTYNSPVLVR